MMDFSYISLLYFETAVESTRTVFKVRDANPGLKWEQRNETNLGVDFSGGRFSGSLDVYQRKHKGLIQEGFVDPTSALSYQNTADLSGRGLELALEYYTWSAGDFQWSTSVVLSGNRTVLDKHPEEKGTRGYVDGPGFGSTNLIRIAVGEKLGQIWGPVFDGVDGNGYPVMKDVNGDGVVNTQPGTGLFPGTDFTSLGYGIPSWELGWGNKFSFRHWQLSAFFRGAFGHSLVNLPRLVYEPLDAGAINSYNRIHSEKAVEGLTSSQYSSLYYTQVNNGSWQQTSSVTVSSGTQVRFGPHPTSGGSWSWSGCGTSGSAREQTVSPTGSCTATATYTNTCGAQSTQTFNVTVSGSGGTFNGTYSFVAQHSGKAIDVAGGGTTNGTNIQQWTYLASNNNERFQVTHLGSGWHRISPVIATGQCIDVSGVSTANGANIHTWTYGGGNNQQWRFENAGNGYWKIIARHSNKCLDVQDISTTDGANIHQWDCLTGAQNQAFQLIAGSSAGGRMAMRSPDVSSETSSSHDFTIYPNPSSGDFTINLSDNNESYRLSIFSAGGKKVYESDKLSPGTHEISPGLEKGMYFIKADGNKYFDFKKLIIK